MFASPTVVQALIDAGSSISRVSQGKYYNAPALHPLSFTILREDEDAACSIAEILFKAGAVSSTADEETRTIFHEAVAAGRTKLVSCFLRTDPKALSVINFPIVIWATVFFPLSTAIKSRDYSTLTTLLAYGVNIKFTEDDIGHALIASDPK